MKLYLHRFLDILISKSLAVFVTATILLKEGMIDQHTWFFTALAFLGYNLYKAAPVFGSKGKEQNPDVAKV
jgi:hypothetical protein